MKGLRGWRRIGLARSELGGRLDGLPTLEQEAAHARDAARFAMSNARDEMAAVYRELRRYPDARFRSLLTNRTAQLHHRRCKTALRSVRLAVQQAEALEVRAAAARPRAA